MDDDCGLKIQPARDLTDVRRYSHEAMATVFEVHAVHSDQRYAAQAAHAAFDLVDRLESELSRFIPNSDIGRINHLAAGETIRVSPSTMDCLVLGRGVFDLTDGAFDISIGTGLPSLEFDPVDCTVRATEAGVQVDLGGIGKGYAVDRMAKVLEEWGLEASLVHGGFSSVLALEPPAGRDGWALTLSDPSASSRVLSRLSVRQAALAASGVRKRDHIVDARTGEPARGRLAAWVAAPRPEEARTEDGPPVAIAAVLDALTTAFMILSTAAIEDLCGRCPGLEAWILKERTDDERAEPRLLHFGSATESRAQVSGLRSQARADHADVVITPDQIASSTGDD